MVEREMTLTISVTYETFFFIIRPKILKQNNIIEDMVE